MAPRPREARPRTRLLDVVADRVRELRERRGIRADVLAARMTELGVEWTRDIVTKLETRQRKTIDLQELVALARALNVPPALLLIPPEAQSIPLVPMDGEVTPYRALLWWIGEATLDTTDPARAGWEEEAQRIDLVRDHYNAWWQVNNSLRDLEADDFRAAKGDDVEAARRDHRRVLDISLRDLRRFESDMKDKGMQPPRLAELAEFFGPPEVFLERLADRGVDWKDEP